MVLYICVLFQTEIQPANTTKSTKLMDSRIILR